MSDTQAQLDTQNDSSIRPPRSFTGIFVGGLIFLFIMLLGLSLWIESYFDKGLEFVFEYEKFECQPFSTWPLNKKLFPILLHTREALIFPTILLILYAYFGVSRVDKRGVKVAVPLMLILLSILCSSCYVSLAINFEQHFEEILMCSLRIVMNYGQTLVSPASRLSSTILMLPACPPQVGGVCCKIG
jgi:hypothetical protein